MISNRMIKRLIILGILLFAGSALFACDMSFFLISSDEKEIRITPDMEIELNTGDTYTLLVNFKEDHGNCTVPAENTIFLLDDEKWKYSREESSLIIKELITWEQVSAKAYQAIIPFTVRSSGEIYLEIIRECAKKDGYDEVFSFISS